MAKRSGSSLRTDLPSSGSKMRALSSGSVVIELADSDEESRSVDERNIHTGKGHEDRPRSRRSTAVMSSNAEVEHEDDSMTEPESGSDEAARRSPDGGTPPLDESDETDGASNVTQSKLVEAEGQSSEARLSLSEHTNDSDNEPSTSAITLEDTGSDTSRKFPKLLKRRNTSDVAADRVSKTATPTKAVEAKKPSKTLGFSHAAHGKPLSSIIKAKVGTPIRTAVLQKQAPISSIVSKSGSPSTKRRFGLAKKTIVPPMHAKERQKVEPRAPRTVVIDTQSLGDEDDEAGEYKENIIKTRLLAADSKKEREAYMIRHFTEGCVDDGDAQAPSKFDGIEIDDSDDAGTTQHDVD